MKDTLHINVRPAGSRGHAQHGWLESFHTFSFADYHDPKHMGFRSLRVINEDRVAPGKGFSPHPHRDMEIFSYIIDGALAHNDSMGHAATVTAGQVQKITAGTGIVHSEFNASDTQEVHFLQIWILPKEKGLTPSYQEYTPEPAREALTLIGSPQGGDNVVRFHQDILVYKGDFKEGTTVHYKIKPGRGLWLQMINGVLTVDTQELAAGDGAAIEGAEAVTLSAAAGAECLLMDMA